MTKSKDTTKKSLKDTLNDIDNHFGKGTVMRMGDRENLDIPSISTGSLGLDIALGIGGIPKGRVTEIYGPESSGKTTLTLQIIAQYLRIKNGTNKYEVPRTIIFGGKAAPGYFMAKLMMRFINGIADVVNSDPDMDGLLRVVFLPDYNVKLGEIVYPATDLSEQISTAGKEASGTGNMKFAMNGALTIGTLDGANVELRDLVKKENFFLFGKTESEIMDLKNNNYSPKTFIDQCPELKEVIRLIEIGHFSNGDKELFKPLLNSLTGHDPFFVMADFENYLNKQDVVSECWNNKKSWNKMALLNTARSGYFSSDRSIREYCKSIWKVSPMPVEITCDVEELTN